MARPVPHPRTASQKPMITAVVAAQRPTVSSGARGDNQSVVVLPRLKPREAEQLHEYELNALSDNSRRAYASDLRAFTAFLAKREPTLVATPEKASYVHGLLFLNDMANRGLAIATINRRWAFLRRHLIPSLCAPEIELQYRHVIAGMRRKLEAGLVRGKAPILERDLYNIVSLLTDRDLRTRQSRLLLLFLFHSAMRRSEVQVARWENLTFKPQSLVIRIPVSKTGKNQQISIPRRAREQESDLSKPCVVHLLERWKRLQRPSSDRDFVFRKLNRKGELTSDPIPIHEMVRIVKDGVTLLSVDRLVAEDVSCHSLRSGFCTSAADRSVPLGSIRERSRHRSVAGLQPYLRSSQVEDYGI